VLPERIWRRIVVVHGTDFPAADVILTQYDQCQAGLSVGRGWWFCPVRVTRIGLWFVAATAAVAAMDSIATRAIRRSRRNTPNSSPGTVQLRNPERSRSPRRLLSNARPKAGTDEIGAFDDLAGHRVIEMLLNDVGVAVLDALETICEVEAVADRVGP
jgi:hypothetical protein